MKYLINKNANTTFIGGNGQPYTIDVQMIEDAVMAANEELKSLYAVSPKVFPRLKMRNLSGFIGETYVDNFADVSTDLFIKNPHQDGYPDLLLNDEFGRTVLAEIELSGKMMAKAPFSPCETGGTEVKATCGSVPTPAECAKRDVTKPDMGDTRIDLMKGYTWAAHHRQTTNLTGIFWDFDDTMIPQIAAVFFGNSIDESDWSVVSVPKEGSRTTNASNLTRAGVKKMYDNWVLVKDDSRYIDFLNHYNNDNLIG